MRETSHQKRHPCSSTAVGYNLGGGWIDRWMDGGMEADDWRTRGRGGGGCSSLWLTLGAAAGEGGAVDVVQQQTDRGATWEGESGTLVFA